jgi:molybdate transport system permease protein
LLRGRVSIFKGLFDEVWNLKGVAGGKGIKEKFGFTGIGSDKVFKFATIAALAVVVIFFASLLISLFSYTSWSDFTSAILSSEILFAVRLSIITATLAAIFSMIIAVPAAYALSHSRFPGKSIVDSLLDLPIVLSPIAIGAALLIFFNTPVGSSINNNFNFVFAVPGIILAQITIVVALAIRLLKSTFDSIDPRYEMVSRTLGYSKFQAFRSVTLPMAKNGLISASILTWARAVGEFGATVTLAGATAMKTETLPISIFLSLSSADVQKAIAVILILVIIALVALLFIRKVVGKRPLI